MLDLFAHINNNSKKKYKEEINSSIKKKWPKEAIEIEELIYECYNEKSTNREPQGNQNILIFIDINLDVDWIVTPDLSNDANKLVSRAMLIESLPHKHLPKSEIIEFKKIIGLGILAGINDDSEEVDRLVAQARSFHKKRVTERSRIWSLQISTPIILSLFIYILFSQYFEQTNNSIYIVATISGMFGGFLSLVQQTGALALDSSSGFKLHFFEICTKLMVAGISGFMAAYIGKTVLTPEIVNVLLNDMNGFVTLAFSAGFSERLIPNMVSSYETKIGD